MEISINGDAALGARGDWFLVFGYGVLAIVDGICIKRNSLRTITQSLWKLPLVILQFLAALYAVILLAALVLRFTVGERWMLVGVLNNNLTQALMIMLPILVICLLFRRWRLAVLYAPAFVFFLWAYLPYYLPRPVEVPPDAPQISLLTYNLQAEETLLEPMVNVIREADADVVALQEMSTPAAKLFDAELADLYPYRVFYPEPNGGAYHGRGLLSRYPIVENDFWPVRYPIPVRLQRAVLDVNGLLVTVYNFHAPPSQPIFGQGVDLAPRAEQITDLVKMAEGEDGAVLLMGDFNTTDLDENYGRITAHFTDVFRAVGWGMGFTNPDWQHDNPRRGASWMPMYQRIDYVFYNTFFVPVEARVWSSSGGSDHRPLYVVLAMPNTAV